MRKLKKGDSVIVIAGKDKGKKGEILKVIDDNKLIVTNVNLAKKHTKPNPNKEETGGIIEREMPLNISNVMIFNPITKKADKVGCKTLENGKKVRIYKSNKEVIDI
tara:strand:- start:1051 stop:1368 length:318 start_codon:yes stop_codon:yes gene_type:complete